MPLLDESHDLAHPVEGDGAWSESYYFNCYDPMPTSASTRGSASARTRGRSTSGSPCGSRAAASTTSRHVREQRTMVDTVLEVGDVRYEMLEPMQQLAPHRRC